MKIKPDPRQKKFYDFIEAINCDEKKTINLQGFPASYVNLGWLKDNLTALIEKNEIQNLKDIVDFLRNTVQRLKKFEIKIKKDILNKNKTHYIIFFSTKDDYGWYDYSFNVRTEKKLKEK